LHSQVFDFEVLTVGCKKLGHPSDRRKDNNLSSSPMQFRWMQSYKVSLPVISTFIGLVIRKEADALPDMRSKPHSQLAKSDVAVLFQRGHIF